MGRISNTKPIPNGPKNPPDPAGGISTYRDDRGHLVPEGGVHPNAAIKVNTAPNIVAEQIIINQHYKKSFEDSVKKYAQDNPTDVVMTLHAPIYSKNDTKRKRPSRIQHYFSVNGKIFSAFTFKNSKKDILTR